MTEAAFHRKERGTPYSVIVADDDARVCAALAELIADDPRFDVIGIGRSGHDAALLASEHQVDLAIIDIQMPGGGVEAIAGIHAISPRTRVAVYSAKRGSRVRAEMIDAGAAGFFNKGDVLDLTSALVALLTSSSSTLG